jgi:hypothetical protein
MPLAHHRNLSEYNFSGCKEYTHRPQNCRIKENHVWLLRARSSPWIFKPERLLWVDTVEKLQIFPDGKFIYTLTISKF